MKSMKYSELTTGSPETAAQQQQLNLQYQQQQSQY